MTGREPACPNCGRQVPSQYTFCGACGTRLGRAIPGQASWSSVDLLRGERRPATVALSDLCGYTAMTESCDPEEVASIMNTIKSEAVRIVEAHGGIVNQFVGDQIVALFGIPAARGDDAQRAVSAALELHEFVQKLAPRVGPGVRDALRMHTGIQSGLVVAELQDRLNGIYGLTGDTVNTAARLLALAGPDQVIIGDRTLDQVDQYFETRSGGTRSVKGKARDIGTYLVVGPRADLNRFGPARARGLTPWTGRTAELAQLSNAFDEAASGSGRIVVVEGEPGTGKSRLCHEFLLTVDRCRAAAYTGRCQSYGSAVPYLPFVEVLRSSLGVGDTQSIDTIVERTVSGVRDIDRTLERYVPVYLQLLSVSNPEHDSLPTGPEDLVKLMQDSIVALTTALSSKRPTVLFLDDWHWADEASQATLSALSTSVPEHAVLIVVARRPDRQSHWETVSSETIVLEPFGPDETADIVARCFDAALVDPPLVHRIHGRTHGNPLFVEEVCRSLAQTGRVRRDPDGILVAEGEVEDLELPETVQAVLLSRVDALQSELRNLLRVAAVIGQDFSREILNRLVPPEWPTERLLMELEELGFVHRLPRNELSDFRFKHVTTQEVTYSTLLRSERARAHRQIAEVLESLDQADQQVEAIARHYRLAGVNEKAVEFLERAALKARRASAVQEAKQHLYEAVQCSAALGDDEATKRQRVRLTLRWAEACIFSPSKDQIGMLEEAYDSAQAIGDASLAVQSLYWISWIYYSVGEHLRAESVIRRAIAGVTHEAPPGLESLMRMHLGYCLVSQRRPDALVILEDGIERRQRAARIFEHRLNDSDGYGFALLGLARADLGDFAGADELISRGLEIVRAVGRRPAESSILITRSVAELFRSNWEGVLAAAAQARDIAVHLRAPYHLAFSDVLSGYAQYRLGELTGGIDSMWRGLEDLERSGAFLSKALSQACIADALSRSGRLAEAEVLARSALERSEVGDLLGDEYAHRALLRVDTQRSRIAAERRVRMLRANAEIRQSRRQSAISELAEAEAAWLLGRPEEAAALASIALDHLEVLAMPGEMEEARALLAAHGRTGERRK